MFVSFPLNVNVFNNFSLSSKDTQLKLLYVGLISTFGIGLPYLIMTHIFRQCDPTLSSEEYRLWIRKVCGGSTSAESTYKFGFVKASFRRFFTDMKLFFFPQPQAELGKLAPDCELINIHSGKVLSLLDDYIKKMPSGMPLILNMGSYT